MKEVRLRFAPSPTGYLHIGGLRTALYNYLFARHHDGKFILRIEDTDRTRYVEGAIENLIESLQWAGIEYDEGVFIEDGKLVQKGDYGPYIQSERLDIYKRYVDELIEKGHAYYCFCSKERLDKVREEQKIKGLIPKYDGFCRSLSLEEAKERIAKGEEYVVRLKLPPNKDIKFDDLVRGSITINTEDIDDQVLLKSDGYPTYHMAVVVDDHLMGITHIVRGEEWLPSTPKHIYLYEVFGWEKPVYVHLPTVLNKDRKKLSKRHGDVSVEDFKEKGYLPEGLINYLALVGWSPEDNEEILTMEDLIKKFSFERVSKTGGIFDKDKLDWVNAHHIRSYDLDKLTRLAIPYLKEANLIDDQFVSERYDWIRTLVETVREGLSNLSEIVGKVGIFFNNQIEPENEEALSVLKGEQVPLLLNAFKEELENIEEIDGEFAKTIMKKIQKSTGIKGKNLFMPVRVALTGYVHGPELVSIIYLLGKQNILDRIEYVEKSYL
ncbi:glutamate--tRNA ligase [Tepidimicrobium xylanilyticum]|uniref:Glutamate--tRNA ligase n=1 Tax=Tepidimicrobium xylanilyticum TaxID=1123352 RepID=A0A1H3D585_9FIRM|nr:glutamate--tRNA ligase [Tepidimicrobium xylanilyticum]GMG97894.1 glutamate--tRNA ligase [Tepidimicrobium xylanilyticum]SDX60839.1 nondiscriminating glutamyl-tRNA synthetase [Tepidimicrobium xylanilyticum]